MFDVINFFYFWFIFTGLTSALVVEEILTVTLKHYLIIQKVYINGVGMCQKVGVGRGGGTQTRNLCTFGKEPI